MRLLLVAVACCLGAAANASAVPTVSRVSPVRVDSKQPLVVAFDGATDGQGADYLAIADARDRRVPGRARLTDGESSWRFSPSAPWRAGVYKLVIRGTLEDPAGNRPRSRFETSIDSPARPPVDAVLPFTIGHTR